MNHSIRRQHHFNQLTRIQFSPKSLKIWEKKTRFAHCSRCISRTYILFYFFFCIIVSVLNCIKRWEKNWNQNNVLVLKGWFNWIEKSKCRTLHISILVLVIFSPLLLFLLSNFDLWQTRSAQEAQTIRNMTMCVCVEYNI